MYSLSIRFLKFLTPLVLLSITAGCSTSASVGGPQDAPLTPVYPGGSDDQSRLIAPDLIETFSVYVPADLAACRSNNPWGSGKRELVDWGGLSSGTCFALGYSLKQPSYAFLIYEDPQGKLSRLRPDDCRISDRQTVAAGVLVDFPQPDKIIELDQNPGAETFHLLAIRDRQTAARTLAAILELPSPGSSCARPKGLIVRELESDALKQLVNSDSEVVQWQTRTIVHR